MSKKVYGFTDEKEKIEVYTKVDFVFTEIIKTIKLTQTVTSPVYMNGSVAIDFPEGFTRQNTHIVSVLVKSATDTSSLDNYDYRMTNSYYIQNIGLLREVMVNLYDPLGIEDEEYNRITINCNKEYKGIDTYFQVKILLMKIDTKEP